MIVVRIESPTGAVVLHGEAGDRLLDLLDGAGAPIDVSCRAANCASCLVDVEGAHLLAPASEEERAVLTAHAAGARARLACQAVLTGEGGLVLRPRPLRGPAAR